MPGVSGKSSVLAKFGGRLDKLVKKVAGQELDPGQIQIPGGISNGIARLKKCYFGLVAQGKKNAGQPFMRAVGIVYEPKSVTTPDGVVPVAGLQTSVMFMMCETKDGKGNITSEEDNLAEVANALNLLANDKEFTMVDTIAEYEELAKQLEEAKPFFRFSTRTGGVTKEYPTPRVWESWHGSKGLEDYAPPEESAAVVEDDTDAEPAKPSANGKKPTTSTAAKKPTAKPEPEEEPEETGGTGDEFDEEVDIDSLVKKAAKKDKEAQEVLTQMALTAGHSEEVVSSAENWQEVADLIASPPEEPADEPQEQEEEPEAPVITKGNVYRYRPLDPKTKKRAVNKKGQPLFVEVEVTGVDRKTDTATCKSNDDGTTVYKGVKFADLLPLSEDEAGE